MKRREILVALGATTLVAALAGPGLAQERLAMGATFSSSSYYTYQVGIANYLNSTVEGLDLSVQELGGGEVSTQALLRGEIDMGIATTSSDYAAVNGEAPFEGTSDTLRTLYFFAPTPINFVVDAASNVQSLSDLKGVKFNPGGRGTSTERQVDMILAVLGIGKHWNVPRAAMRWTHSRTAASTVSSSLVFTLTAISSRRQRRVTFASSP